MRLRLLLLQYEQRAPMIKQTCVLQHAFSKHRFVTTTTRQHKQQPRAAHGRAAAPLTDHTHSTDTPDTPLLLPQLSSGTPLAAAGCTKRLGTRRTTWLAQCTLPYMDVTLLKSIT